MPVHCPVPVRVAVAVLPPPLLATLSFPLRVPFLVGWNQTLSEQLVPAASELAQVLSEEVEAGGWPRMLEPVRFTEVVLTFEMVTGCGALVWPTVTGPKFRAVGESAIDIPVPLRVTRCGLLGALSVSCKMPVREAFAVGVNPTVIGQLLPART